MGLVHERERLADAHAPGQRLTWGDRFELIHLPRQGRGVRWTWRMTDAEYLTWRDRIDVAVRHRDGADLARQLVWSLSRVPGFGGLRDQVKGLRSVFMREWRRRRGESEPLPAMSGLAGYVRRTSCESEPLSVMVRADVGGASGAAEAGKARAASE